MTQIASLLAVATVFIDLCTPFYSQGGGPYPRDKSTYAGIWAKNAGEGRNRRILWE